MLCTLVVTFRGIGDYWKIIKSKHFYQTAQTPVTLNVLEGFKAFQMQVVYILCSMLQDFSWHARIVRSLGDSSASC